MADRQHGTGTRGLAHVPREPSYEGRFGRLFRLRPPGSHEGQRGLDPLELSDEQLQPIADAMQEQPGVPQAESGDNSRIPSGYTYLGQFVDHDLTFDASSSAQRRIDPEGRLSFRSPRFDLDSLYGSGPVDEPFQYDQTGPRTGRAFLLDRRGDPREVDLPRNGQGRALIGDPRNDENTLVSQLHCAFLQFHNRMLERLAAQGVTEVELFDQAQQQVRWHYQWVVVHDFLRRLIGDELHGKLLTQAEDDQGRPRDRVRLRHYRYKANPFMPVEFSAAAYRFGHSQVRERYLINQRINGDRPVFNPQSQPGDGSDYRGFQPLIGRWAVSWPRLFPLDDTPVQLSRLIDTKLAPSLFALPGETSAQRRSLALRNLQAGVRLGLPSGQQVAQTMGAPVLTTEQLAPCPPGQAPLWFYVLAEAASELGDHGQHLGPVGGRLVGETFLGLLRADPTSYYNASDPWLPDAELSTDQPSKFDMADLLRFAVPPQTAPF